jgi:hypothetical protein
MTDTTTFTLAEALAAQQALRDASGLKEEPLDLAELIGMLSEEIDLLLDQDKSWDDIAAVLQKSTGKAVTGSDVENHYVSPDDRDAWDDDDEYDGEGHR